METQTNKIELAGKITELKLSHNVFEEKFYSANMEIKRLSSCTDIIPLTIPEKLVIGNSITDNSFIYAEGQLRSYNYYLKVNGLDQNKRSKLVITAFCKATSSFVDYINNVELDGYICKAPIFRQTPFGKQITDLLVAVNRSYGKSDYIPVIFWGSNALKARELAIGSHIGITGRLQSREYEKITENNISEKRITYEVSGFKLSVI